MIRLIVAASLGVALIASSAEATVYCNADGTPQGIDDTGKFDQQAISGRFNNAASVFGDLRID